MAEQRYQAVLAVISDGLAISQVASKFGVKRPGFVHTRLLVGLRYGGCLLGVVAGFELHWWCAIEAVHEPAGVVPVDPVGGEYFDVGYPVERAAAKGRVFTHGFGLVQADRGLGQGVIVGIPDRADRWLRSGQREGLTEAHRGVLRPRVGVMNSAADQWVSLTCPYRGGLAYRGLDEAGVLARGAFPAHDSAGEASMTNAV